MAGQGWRMVREEDPDQPDDGKGRKCPQTSRKVSGPGGTTPCSGLVLLLVISLKIMRGKQDLL